MPLPSPISSAARTLLQGGVIAYPTEGVYGIGCIPDFDFAVERVLEIKGRRADAGLILLAGELDQLLPWIAPTPTELARLTSSSTYPVTWIVSAEAAIPELLTGGRGTVAVRLTNHPIVRTLCAATDSALVSTSANRRGRPPARSALLARKMLGLKLDQVVAGALGNASGPSEIRVAHSDQLLRPRA